MTYISRRGVLRGATAIGFTSAAGLLGTMGTAHAADTSGYKALVCVFLKGGMDAMDTVLPTDAESHTALREARVDMFNQYGVGSGDSSRDIANLLPLGTARDFGGRSFGLPRELAPLHDLYAGGKMAIVGNVGPLVEPTTRTTMENKSAVVPPRLFSHNDQQSTWMTGGLEGRRIGWGGEFADRVAPLLGTAKTFASITASRPEPFLDADRTRQYPAKTSGAVKLSVVEDEWRLGGDADAARQVLADHYASRGRQSDNPLIRDLIAANTRTQDDNALFTGAIADAPLLTTVFPDTKLGRQLETVALTIAIQGTLGVSRQLFYAERGGFDTHDRQVQDLPARHGEVAEAIAAFNAAMVELGRDEEVTLFTMSDFGRTAFVNGDGTDHGWGGHHFVVGGAVRGGEIYGDIPDLDFGSERYTKSRGRMIPDMSVDQYAASLGKWFGLAGDELRNALPHLGNFDGVPDLFGLGATV